MQNSKTRTITYTALFAAVATVLMFFDFPLPLMPPFLKLDFSGVPIMLCAFMFGPVPALLATAVKDLIQMLFSTSAGVGPLADFLILGSFAVTAGLLYRRKHTRRGAVIGCAVSTAVMVVVGMIANKYILIPFYIKAMGMPLDVILALCAKVNPLIGDMNTYIIFGAGGFTLFKGILISAITFVLYKRLHRVIGRDMLPRSEKDARKANAGKS